MFDFFELKHTKKMPEPLRKKGRGPSGRSKKNLHRKGWYLFFGEPC